ncbi:MAG: GNAT family N-acetyltransferase [Planctomycetaceae bacterium]|jgi:GNAT superfamily N-acetyltransferase|nr:GNAT family N-acetyltransferase [Planctomycetaceae bacterium]
MTYPVSLIEWDSRFFGFPIGTVDIPSGYSQESLEHSLQNARKRFRLICINLHENGPEKLVIQDVPSPCYDRKIVFKKLIDNNIPPIDPHVRSYTSSFCSPMLERLAIQSGTMTRFKNDPELSTHYERLFLTWINYAVTKELADSIWTWYEEGQHIGLATIRCAKRVHPETGQIEREGRIGLFAVDSKHRHRGIGTGLFDACDFWCSSLGIPSSTIVTQQDNDAMITLCKKIGFEIKREESVYHYWSPGWVYDVHQGWLCRKTTS